MERNAYFDNAKLILIFTVVFGHMLQPFVDGSRAVNALYMWIYTFNMPAFIFLAGFFARGSNSVKDIVKLAQKLIYPYIIFQLIYTIFYYFIGKDNWQTSIFYPHWSLWFLISLFSWHILLHWFKKISPTMGVLISIQIGLMIGYIGDIGHMFSLSRTFVFFPFFLLGYWLTTEKVMLLKQRNVKVLSLLIMVAIAVAIYIAPEFNSGWLLASKSYDDLGLPDLGGLARLLVYMTSSLMVIGFLAWVPQKKFKFTYLGSRTLYVYLLHGFFIQFFRAANLFTVNNVLDVFGLAAISIVIVFLLSSKPVLGLWQPFIEGRTTIIKSVLRDY